jgi:hypothetical protein
VQLLIDRLASTADTGGSQVVDRPFINPVRTTQASKRAVERRSVAVPGRLTWRDARGMMRFATVTTRDVSEQGVYLECRAADAIPLHRLVYLQLERDARDLAQVPASLKDGRVLSAVYRVGPHEPTTGTPSGYALRLLVDPRARAASHARERSIA